MKYFLGILIFSSFLFSFEIEIGEGKFVKDGYEIPIIIKADQPYKSLQFKIEYDKGEMVYLGIRWGNIAKDTLNVINDKIDGEIRGALASAKDLPGEGIVCYLKFNKIGKLKFKEFLIDDRPAKIKMK